MIIQNGKTIHIQTKNCSYVMYRNPQEDLLNFHFGGKIADWDYSAEKPLLRPESLLLGSTGIVPNLGAMPQEYPTFGRSDSRHPVLELTHGEGNRILALKYRECRILEGQAFQMDGMPTLRAEGEADTLEVVLTDETVGVEVLLYYVVFAKWDVIARNAVIVNHGQRPVQLHAVGSCNLDLPRGDYELVHFCGDWCAERGMERTMLHNGALTEIADNTGRGSRINNPFVMVAEPGADEEQGRVYGFNLIYSGNHSTVAEKDSIGRLRIQQGISPRGFAWTLKTGEAFMTPQSVMCYSREGFGQLSRNYHNLYKNHLIPKRWVNACRPVLLNSWEGCYFDFDEARLLSLAQKAKQVGIELFVLDDGWFGKRNDAKSSLGDWVVNRNKLPDGLDGLAKKLKEMGMSFGLWFEPEMVSPDSDLYRAHPDWAVRVPQIEPLESRWQYVLDLSRQEVCDYIVEAVSAVLESAEISYVKWDMNRPVWDVPADGFYHSYVLGYYDIMARLTQQFPEILFEGCCSGGGRFDPGVLAYMPQIWTSDNSDAIARLKIQYSTSMCYPLSTMGAHVSAVPNHQTGRVTELKTRADVAYFGIFGYELDMAALDEEALTQISAQTEFAKRIQPLIQTGDFYRLRNPYETEECVWQVVSPQKDHVFLMACRVLSQVRGKIRPQPRVMLKGLEPDAVYRDVQTGNRFTGDLLMERGLIMEYENRDFATCTLELRKEV